MLLQLKLILRMSDSLHPPTDIYAPALHFERRLHWLNALARCTVMRARSQVDAVAGRRGRAARCRPLYTSRSHSRPPD